MNLSYFIIWSYVTFFVNWTNRVLCKEEEEPLVYEMDDRVIDFTTQGKWLIMFYAPWWYEFKIN